MQETRKYKEDLLETLKQISKSLDDIDYHILVGTVLFFILVIVTIGLVVITMFTPT
jgi:hypothetical protein